LTEAEAYELLASGRKPKWPEEKVARELGYHALALDVAAAAIGFYGAEPFGTFCAALADQTSDELKLAGEPADTLPTAQQSSVAATLLRSIERLAEEGKDLLRLACLVAAAPIPHWLVETVFASADGLEA
jgi:hypothetical protein